MSKQYNNSLVLLMLCFLIVVGLACLSSVSAETVYVDADNTEGPWEGSEEFPFLSIQDAIDKANESDDITVYSGTYNENIVVDKSVSITGAGADLTTIAGVSSTDNTVDIVADEVFFSGFTIDNDVGSSSNYDCIRMPYVSNCSITDNVFEHGNFGLYVLGSDDNIISGNLFQNNYKGLRLSYADANSIEQNIIKNNDVGIYATLSNKNKLIENDIFSNNIGLNIASNSLNNVIYKNDFDNNGLHARDTCTNNYSKNDQGNYWDDYDDYDDDGDGIGDSAYQIDGGSNEDGFPLGDFLTPDPVAYIDSISPNPAIEGDSIDFYGHGTPSENIVDWQWSSSKDGLIHEGSADFSSSSLSSGSHTIKFRVKDGNGEWSDYETDTLVVNEQSSLDNEVPTATIVTISPLEAKAGESVYFHGYGTDDDGSIVAYNWRSSKDDLISTESSFTISSLSVGTHEISFKVKDDSGDWSSIKTKTLVIVQNVSLNNDPVAELNGPFSGTVDSPVLFDASDSYDPDDDVIETYHWDFGDGKSGSGKIISHSFNQTGNFSVTLTVTDEGGAYASVSSFVIISNQSSNQNSGNEINDNDDSSEGGFPSIPGFQVILLIIGFIVFSIVRKR